MVFRMVVTIVVVRTLTTSILFGRVPTLGDAGKTAVRYYGSFSPLPLSCAAAFAAAFLLLGGVVWGWCGDVCHIVSIICHIVR